MFDLSALRSARIASAAAVALGLSTLGAVAMETERSHKTSDAAAPALELNVMNMQPDLTSGNAFDEALGWTGYLIAPEAGDDETADTIRSRELEGSFDWLRTFVDQVKGQTGPMTQEDNL